jgi:hypothetical protein
MKALDEVDHSQSRFYHKTRRADRACDASIG